MYVGDEMFAGDMSDAPYHPRDIEKEVKRLEAEIANCTSIPKRHRLEGRRDELAAVLQEDRLPGGRYAFFADFDEEELDDTE